MSNARLADPPPAPRIIHVQSASKMTFLISTALVHFNNSSAPALILHSSSSTSTSAISNAIPKLVSVVEIIKRSYLLALSSLPPAVTAASTKGKQRARDDDEDGDEEMEERGAGGVAGLHQYTHVSAVERLDAKVRNLLRADVAVEEEDDEVGGVVEEEGEGEDAEVEEARREKIAMEWLQVIPGKTKRPRMKHTPFILVILSTCRIEEYDDDPLFTYQPPSIQSAPPTPAPLKSNPSTATIAATRILKKMKRTKLSTTTTLASLADADADAVVPVPIPIPASVAVLPPPKTSTKKVKSKGVKGITVDPTTIASTTIAGAAAAVVIGVDEPLPVRTKKKRKRQVKKKKNQPLLPLPSQEDVVIGEGEDTNLIQVVAEVVVVEVAVVEVEGRVGQEEGGIREDVVMTG